MRKYLTLLAKAVQRWQSWETLIKWWPTVASSAPKSSTSPGSWPLRVVSKYWRRLFQIKFSRTPSNDVYRQAWRRLTQSTNLARRNACVLLAIDSSCSIRKRRLVRRARWMTSHLSQTKLKTKWTFRLSLIFWPWSWIIEVSLLITRCPCKTTKIALAMAWQVNAPLPTLNSMSQPWLVQARSNHS